MDLTQAAANLIFEARRDRTTVARLPEHLRPTTKEAAIAVQRAVTNLLQKPVRAWKCAVPKPDRFPCAPIFDLFEAGAVPVVPATSIKLIEPEVAFVLSKDLRRRETPYSESEVRAGIASAHLVVEVLGPRFSQFMETDIHEKVADHIVNESLVLGPEISVPVAETLQGFDFTMSSSHGVLVHMKATHPDGAPFGGLLWLVNYLCSEGLGLSKGDVITTGSYAGFVNAPLGQELTLTYGDLGSVKLELLERQHA